MAYAFVIPRDLIKTDDDFYILNISFKPYSGESNDFEGRDDEDMFYANYKVSLTMGLMSAADGSWLSKSEKSDYVIYTNARILSDVQ